MAEKSTKKFGERAAEFGRNFNAVLALGSAAVALAVPGPNILLSSYATLNAVQAGGWEFLRRLISDKNKTKV